MEQSNRVVIFLYALCIIILFTIITCNIYGIVRSCCWRWRWRNRLKFFFGVNCFPFYAIFILFKRICRMPRKKSRPPKDNQLTEKPRNWLFRSFNCILSCIFHNSPVGCQFTNSLSVTEAISRYAEQKIAGPDKLLKKLKEDKFLDLILTLLNKESANFFFKVLPSGSLREGYGKPLPSTSILGTDYDLMLIPDGIEVVENVQLNNQEVGTNIQTNVEDSVTIEIEPDPKDYLGRQTQSLESSRKTLGDMTPLFQAVSDPNQNPQTPNGYVWLKLLNTSLKSWTRLCFDRITTTGVEKFLSQASVYNQIREAIGIDNVFAKIVIREYLFKHENVEITCRRNGPAVTITVEKENKCCCCIENGEELFHCDFTFALYCPKFPKCAQDFFLRRQDSEKQIFWPTQETLNKIKKTGCHVVPKPSTKELYSYIHEQQSQTFLSQGVALEFRYSFSQAEIILSDEIPDNARIVFLAFKGTIKKVVNYVPDTEKKFHPVPSYVLKTILLWQVEKKPTSYWDSEDVLEEFFMEMLTSLQESFEKRICPMYWNPSLNLVQGMEDDDFIFISDRLQYIRNNMVEAIADDWLELERCVQLNCCRCCVHPKYKVNTFERDLKQCNLDLIQCEYKEWDCCEKMPYDEEFVYVY